MKQTCRFIVATGFVCLAFSQPAFAVCEISEESKQLDPVEVGFCEADAVFTGKVQQRLETIRAFRPEGEEKTKHFRIQQSTVGVAKSYKDKVPAKALMITDLYDKQGAFSFEPEKEYLVFAKKLPGENEYAGASAACSVQPTLLLVEASKALEQLEQHKKGRKKIDCKNIRPKDKS